MLSTLPNYLIESSPQSSEAFLPSFYRLVPWTTKSFSSWNISSTFSVSPPTFKLKLYPWRILKQSWLLDWLSSLKALLFKKGLRGFCLAIQGVINLCLFHWTLYCDVAKTQTPWAGNLYGATLRSKPDLSCASQVLNLGFTSMFLSIWKCIISF